FTDDNGVGARFTQAVPVDPIGRRTDTDAAEYAAAHQVELAFEGEVVVQHLGNRPRGRASFGVATGREEIGHRQPRLPAQIDRQPHAYLRLLLRRRRGSRVLRLAERRGHRENGRHGGEKSGLHHRLYSKTSRTMSCGSVNSAGSSGSLTLSITACDSRSSAKTPLGSTTCTPLTRPSRSIVKRTVF